MLPSHAATAAAAGRIHEAPGAAENATSAAKVARPMTTRRLTR
jgi:hypothetical protein